MRDARPPVLIPAGNPGPLTGAGNNTFLFIGAHNVLVDAGTGEPAHLDAIERALGAGRRLDAVFVTHGHVDHVSGSVALAARWPDARFFKMPWPSEDARYGVRWRPISDGDRLPAGDAVLCAIHTPGHSPDHLCFFDKDSLTLYCGDLVLKHGTVVIPPSREGSLEHYLASLHRVRALNARRLIPAHGPAIDRPTELIDAYLAHWRAREAQVFGALGGGPRQVEELVAMIYGRLGTEIERFARENVLAHLLKLEAGGQVARTRNGCWRITEATQRFEDFEASEP